MNPMNKAIDLSRVGLRHGGPFGAVVTFGTEIIGEGFHIMPSQRDPTAHAAVMAIREASRYRKTSNLSGCVIHLSCEPCPLCVAAIYYAGIHEVHYAATRKDAINIGFGLNSKSREGLLTIPPDNLEFVQTCEPERTEARAILALSKPPDPKTDPKTETGPVV